LINLTEVMTTRTRFVKWIYQDCRLFCNFCTNLNEYVINCMHQGLQKIKQKKRKNLKTNFFVFPFLIHLMVLMSNRKRFVKSISKFYDFLFRICYKVDHSYINYRHVFYGKFFKKNKKNKTKKICTKFNFDSFDATNLQHY